MKQRITILFLSSIGIFFIACSSKKVATNAEYEVAKRIFSKQIKANDLYAIGIAPPNKGNDIQLQRDEAIAYAQSEIAKQRETATKSTYKENKSKNDSGEVKKESETTLTNENRSTIRGAKVIDSYQGESGTLYLLMMYNAKEYSDSISIVPDNPFLNDRNKKEVEEEKEKL